MDKMIVYTMLFALAVIPAALSFDVKRTALCYYAMLEDCSRQPQQLMCGSDNVTYNNNCEIVKAYCKDNTVQEAHLGPCTGTSSTSNDARVYRALQDRFCQDITQMHCGSDRRTVCGSNGVTYANICEFHKARCHSPDLHLDESQCL